MAAFVALTGIGLLLMPSAEQTSTLLNACFVAKSVLFVITVSLFCFTSWRLWPARTLASAEEIPKFQQTFRRIAVALLGRNQPLGILAAALLFGALHKGTANLDLETEHVTRELSLVLQALILLSVSAEGLWTWVTREKS